MLRVTVALILQTPIGLQAFSRDPPFYESLSVPEHSPLRVNPS